MPPTPSDIVVVTSAAKLAALIDDAVDRAVSRAVADVLAERQPDAEWLPTREAARAYGKSRSTLHRWAREGLIESRKIGGSVYFPHPASRP